MKRLFLFFLIVGAFFCFIKEAKAETYQLFASPTSTYTWMGYTMPTRKIQEFKSQQAGYLEWIEIRGKIWYNIGEDLAPALYVKINGTTHSCTMSVITGGYKRCTFTSTSLPAVLPDDEIEVWNGALGTGWNFEASTLSPSSTYENSDGFDLSYNPDNGTEINADYWVKYSVTPATSWFSITYPEQFSHLEFEAIETLNITCYSSSSKIAIYDSNDYLTATAEDFVTCSEFAFFDGDKSVQTLFTVKDGLRELYVLDSNYLSSPLSAYLRTLYYYGDLPWSNDLYGRLVYPNQKDYSGAYPVSSTVFTQAEVEILKKDPKSQFSPITGATYTVYYRNYDTNGAYVEDREFYAPTLYNIDPDFWLNERGNFSFFFSVSGSYDNRIQWKVTHQSEETPDEKIIIEFITKAGLETDDFFNEYNVILPSTTRPTNTIPLAPSFCECEDYLNTITGNMAKAFCEAGCGLFYPKKLVNGEIADITQLLETLQTYPPFGYFYVYRDALSYTVSSTVTTTSGWEDLTDWTFFAWIRTMLGYLVYIAFGYVIYKLFSKFL